MIVSILQLMGLARSKPIQSRPEPEAATALADKPSKPLNKGIKRQKSQSSSEQQQQPSVRVPAVTGRDSSSRRQQVNAKNAKPVAKAKTPAPAPTAVKAVKKAAGVAAKPVAAKTAATPVAPKAVAKTAVAKAAAAKPLAVKSAPIKAAPAKAAVAKAPAVAKTAAAPTRPGRVPASAGRAGRPSRLSQITVPSMAQSVASTAAKSSYGNAVSAPVMAPPLFVPARKDPKLANNWKSKSAEELTDAEVLAMSDDEYMNERQVAYFRLKLVRLKEEMLSNAGETTEHLREDTVVVPDPADRATIEEEHALELRTRDRERKLLKKIEQSIGRIDAGDYGYCDETGEPIGVGRLLARPTATLSLEAQQRRELKQKMFGD